MIDDLPSLTAAVIAFISSLRWCNGDSTGILQGCFLRKLSHRHMPLFLWIFLQISLSHAFISRFILFLLQFCFGKVSALEGIWMRKVYMSRQVTKFLEAHQNQEVQVVILAAGYDLLAFTLSQKFTNVPFIEIDHPATGEAKVCTMKKMIDQLPRNLYFCHDAIGKNSTIQEALSKNGLTLRKIPTVIIMEGLSFYLTEEENREIFRELGELFGCDGSIVAFDFFSLDEFGRPSNPNVKRLPFLSSLVKYKVKLMVSHSSLELHLLSSRFSFGKLGGNQSKVK